MTSESPRRWPQWLGIGLLTVAVTAACAAPFLAPHAPSEQFEDRAYAPPTRVHIIDADGWHAPFIHPLTLENRVARRYAEDRSRRIPLEWFAGSRLVATADSTQPLLLLGADGLGRDVFSRVLHGAGLSLGVTLAGVVGALVIGAFIGGLAGTLGGRTDGGLMLLADFLLALPGAYLVLVLRGVLEPALETSQIFFLMSALFALAGWPHAARGVRGIVSTERTRDYAEAARAAGAGPWRLARHLLPAARGFLAVEVVLLVPALLVAEATISYLGLGFADTSASWGTMMHDAANTGVLADAPWLLAPACAVFLVVLGTQLVSLAPGSTATFIAASPRARAS